MLEFTYVRRLIITILTCVVTLVFSPRFINLVRRYLLFRKYGCKEPPNLKMNLDEIHRKANIDHNLLETTTRLFDTYGKTFKAYRSGRVFIRSSDPEVSKAVLSTHFDHFGLQPIRYEDGKGFFGNGMLVTDGKQWKISRALIRPTFDVAHVANMGRLSHHVSRFMNLLPRDGSTVDLFPLLKRLTLDISSEFIFGRSMDALSSPEACEGFMAAFKAAQRDVVIPPHQRPKEYEGWCNEVLEYIDSCINEAMIRIGNTSEAAKNSQVRVIDELVKKTQDRHGLRYLVLSIFSPAHDTVAVILTNAIFHLARHPECWSKLREEILPTASKPLTYELLNSFTFLQWVFRETLRLTPLHLGTVRECLSTTVLPSGGGSDGRSPLLVQKGDLIETNFRAQHRDKSFWGQDADEFQPGRWANIRPTWEYLPFSGGPRICPAFKLVYTESEYILVTIAREFSFLENRDSVFEWVEDRKLTFQSRNGAKVGLIQ